MAEQKYCCGPFEDAVEEGDIQAKLDLDSVGWAVGVPKKDDLNYVYIHCFNCGQVPKPPIKEKS